MSTDWGTVIVAVTLFLLLSPGLLFQIPARTRVVEFGNMSERKEEKNKLQPKGAQRSQSSKTEKDDSK